MSNFLKRFFTSLPLLIIIYISLSNHLILFFILIFISYIVLIELFQLFKKIFINKKYFFTVLFTIILFLGLCFSQLYLFIISDFFNKLIFIYILAICIATDIGGYLFGKLLKGKKLIKVSPNKTYSGLIGSYILSLMVFAYFNYQYNFSLNYLFFTILICTISQIGDLFISLLKRKAKVKDTGKLLPGHGGILDRIDGIIFAIPVGINLLILF